MTTRTDHAALAEELLTEERRHNIAAALGIGVNHV